MYPSKGFLGSSGCTYLPLGRNLGIFWGQKLAVRVWRGAKASAAAARGERRRDVNSRPEHRFGLRGCRDPRLRPGAEPWAGHPFRNRSLRNLDSAVPQAVRSCPAVISMQEFRQLLMAGLGQIFCWFFFFFSLFNRNELEMPKQTSHILIRAMVAL